MSVCVPCIVYYQCYYDTRSGTISESIIQQRERLRFANRKGCARQERSSVDLDGIIDGQQQLNYSKVHQSTSKTSLAFSKKAPRSFRH